MSTTTTPVCDEAADFIIAEEISSPAYYRQALQHPTWPGGASGCTIGIGCDLGYMDEGQLYAAWAAYLPADTIDLLAKACGRKGDAGRTAAYQAARAVIPLDAAMAVFKEVSLPAYADQAAATFPGSADLPPMCRGALVSLVYNRGSAMSDSSPDDRRREMRQIRDAIAGGQPELVPGYLRAMKRLWTNGLVNRREGEAVLFERGLQLASE
jgi:hypothetical protein